MLLSGVRVLEVANVITGPYVGLMLADLGAEVIKIEVPPGGDGFRKWDGGGDGVRPSFAAYNRGKRSIALDLKVERDKEAYRRLLLTADAVVENFRPGVMDRLGFSWSKVRAINPGLVYCHISGMGNTGPERGRPTYDAVAQAFSGLWSQLSDGSDPEPVGPPIADQLTGMYATIAILGALAHRGTSGAGVRVEVDMLTSCLAFQASGIASLNRDGIVPGKLTRARNSQAYAFVAADNRAFAIHLSTAEKFWVALCGAVGQTALIDDPRFADKARRVRNYAELRDTFAEIFSGACRDDWLRRLDAYDVPCAPILDLEEALAHPQVQQAELITGPRGTGDQALHGLVRSPVRVDGKYLASTVAPPRYGEHSEEILASIGLSASNSGAFDSKMR
jgi:crotonobetainyl-CoA:carnitine CoA-transferase CaiB-like acyl-CoA transferase